jgi:hypothetical protein
VALRGGIGESTAGRKATGRRKTAATRAPHGVARQFLYSLTRSEPRLYECDLCFRLVRFGCDVVGPPTLRSGVVGCRTSFLPAAIQMSDGRRNHDPHAAAKPAPVA